MGVIYIDHCMNVNGHRIGEDSQRVITALHGQTIPDYLHQEIDGFCPRRIRLCQSSFHSGIDEPFVCLQCVRCN
ncbi:hypothetical protein BC629DRAFT_1493365 [Irpex lacteus]|nr:hypothetical protein BC629DRAFT_1493365 [Irpex lacteus]